MGASVSLVYNKSRLVNTIGVGYVGLKFLAQQLRQPMIKI